MKNINYYLFSILISVALVNCVKEEDQILGQAEEVLPGLWSIDSVTLPGGGKGISYQGHTFYSDTTLLNIGSIEINQFSADTMGSYESRLACELTIGGESIPVSMNSIFLSGKQLWANFAFNGPDGLHPIDTPAEEFYWSSYIFNNKNYIVEILDSKNIRLLKATDVENHILKLSKL